MSDSQPMNAAQVRAEQKAKKIENVRRNWCAVVSPEGQVHEIILDPPEDGSELGPARGMAPVRWIAGQHTLSQAFRERGFTLFRDECVKSGQPELHDQLHEIAIHRAQGMPIRIPDGDMSKVYPKSVLEKRAAATVGDTGSGMAYVVGEGKTVDPEVREAIDEKLKGLGMTPPEKTLAEEEGSRPAAKRGRAAAK